MQNGSLKLRVIGFEQVTSLAAAAALTVPKGCVAFSMQATAQAVRWRADGTNPTASVGMRVPAAGAIETHFFPPNACRFIQETASAVLNVTYYGE